MVSISVSTLKQFKGSKILTITYGFEIRRIKQSSLSPIAKLKSVFDIELINICLVENVGIVFWSEMGGRGVTKCCF